MALQVRGTGIAFQLAAEAGSSSIRDSEEIIMFVPPGVHTVSMNHRVADERHGLRRSRGDYLSLRLVAMAC
jgi:hypothetical protein